MPRKPASRLPHRHKSSRNGQSSRTGNTRRSSGPSTSSTRPTPLTAAPDRPRVDMRVGPFPHSTSTCTPSETTHRETDYDLADRHDDTLNEIIMAFDLAPRGTVGCCYYIAREEKLFFMEDIQYGDADVIETCECNTTVTSRRQADFLTCDYLSTPRSY